jgi:hypothetical protein
MGTSHLEGQPHGSLLATVEAFLQEYRRCGDLDAGADGDVIWMNCDCGAGIKEVGADLNATRIENPGSPLRRRGQGISRQSYE